MRTWPAILLLALAAPAGAEPSKRDAEEVRIPFPARGGIRNFHAESEDVVYVQDRRRNWYRAELVGPCYGLQRAIRIGFDTRGSSVFDRFSHILVGHERCPIASLEPSERPQRKRRKA
jgi:hypothetical protein